MHRRTAALLVATLLFSASAVAAAAPSSKDEEKLFAGCDWLVRAIAREPDRDDAFGMFMRGMRPKCLAMLEGIARKDNSVRPDAMRQIVKEINELQAVIDIEHGGPPPGGDGPSPADEALQKVADEKAAEEKAKAEREAEERAAADKEAADKGAAEKAEAEKREAERAAAEADKAAEEAKKAAEREAAERAAREERMTDEERRAAQREERQRVAAEKKAAEEAKRAAEREEKQRIAAEKKAAEEAKRAAEREEKERAAAERDAKRQAEALVQAELEAERKAAAEREAQAAAERAARMAAEREAANKKKPARAPKGVDGTWEQPEAKVLDRNVKRTLNLITKDAKVQGELFEEVWFTAPSSWIDASCGGNTTFRMVTTARVNGEVERGSVVLSRDPPRILTCTCSSRCITETRRRGMDLKISASGAELRDATGVFVRPGTALVLAPEDGSSENALSPLDFTGTFETEPFKQRDRTIVQRVEIEVDAGGKLKGVFSERTTQALPLASWAERFCDGADKWEWVTQWKVEGKVSGKKASIKGRDGSNLMCTCPSKCVSPKDKLVFDLVFGATGATLHDGDRVFERR